MYNRSYGQRRPPTIPQNYSGNAFYRVPPEQLRPDPPPVCESECEPKPDAPSPPPCEQECVEKTACGCEKEGCDCRPDSFEKPHGSLPSLPFFGGRGKLFPRGIGGEELLILALILITSSSDESNDLLFFLVLLLFC